MITDILRKDPNFKIIIQAEFEGNHFALARSVIYPSEINKVVRWRWRTRNRSSRKLQIHYFLLWGNSPDINNMGITWLSTEKSKQLAQNKAHKFFFDAVKSSKYININKNEAIKF